MARAVLILLLLVSFHAFPQCGYRATLQTNKDYCIGSSLIASSTHALQNIVWYKNGVQVGSVMGAQSFADKPAIFNIFPDTVGQTAYFSDIGADGAGNIYIADGSNEQVIKWTPASGNKEIVAGPWLSLDFVCFFVDQSGDIYIPSGDDRIIPDARHLVEEFPAGSRDSFTVIPKPAEFADTYGSARTLFVDCGRNIYINTDRNYVTKWAPGDTSGILVARAGNGMANCVSAGGDGRVIVDSAGNIFFLVGNGVQKMVPGSPGAVNVTESACIGTATQQIMDFWMDGKDTIYEDGIDAKNGTLFIEKWAPGASSAETIASFPFSAPSSGRASITMDIRGNLYLVSPGNTNLFELRRSSSIDSAYTPTDTGAYYAVVTDIQGYTTITDTIVINTPSPGPPSIRISATATSTPVCTPITFNANAVNAGDYPAYQWEVSGVKAGGDITTYSYNLFADGDQVYCILSTQAGCAGPVNDTSNIITLDIDPHGAASVAISTPKNSICKGDTTVFTAAVTNGSNQPVFEWLLNGDSTGDTGATFTRNNLSTGDIVTCLITSDDACGLAKSNSIPLTVSIPPTVQGGQIFTILRGHSVILDPVTTGDISSYLWTPATGLSDPTIANPSADPADNTFYTLKVVSPGGCSDTGTVFVNVYTPLSIPNAFTPNGDGHNDRFYVLGGPIGSRVQEFEVFNRFGAAVFHAHGVAPGDPTFAWNGSFHGSPAPTGTYVYMVIMQFADGSHQIYKGTVVLIR